MQMDLQEIAVAKARDLGHDAQQVWDRSQAQRTLRIARSGKQASGRTTRFSFSGFIRRVGIPTDTKAANTTGGQPVKAS